MRLITAEGEAREMGFRFRLGRLGYGSYRTEVNGAVLRGGPFAGFLAVCHTRERWRYLGLGFWWRDYLRARCK